MYEYDINSLGLNPEEFNDVDFDKMPTTIGTIVRPPQPGIYLFQLPASPLMFPAISTVATTDWGQRVQLKLREEAALKNVTLGEPYYTSISNVPRYIGRGENRQAVSDWLMLLKALGIQPDGNNNAAHVRAMLSAGGRMFKAESTLTATCSEKRDIYMGGQTMANRKGCGQRYAVEGWPGKNGKPEVLSIPKDENGLVASRFACHCGAELTSWGRLQGFRPGE